MSEHVATDSIPPAVRAAAEAANARIRELQQNAPPAPAGGQDGGGAAPTLPDPGPGASPAPGGTGEGLPPSPATPELPANQPAPPITVPPDAPLNDPLAEAQAELKRLRDAEKTWKGRHEAEKRRVDELAAEIEELRAAKRTEVVDTGKKALEPITGLTADQIDTLGPELVAAISTQALATIQPVLQQLMDGVEARFEELSGRVQAAGAAVAETKVQKFYREMDAEIPEWREIDQKPEFHEWLDQDDEHSGEQRRFLLDRAANAMQTKRCAKFFRSYMDQHGIKPKAPASVAPLAAAGTGPAANPPAPAPTPPAAADPLAAYAAPGNTRAAPALPAASAPKAWHITEVNAFYADIRHGRRPDTAERRAIEADIAEAMKSGRINYGPRAA